MRPSKKERLIYGITSNLPSAFAGLLDNVILIITLGYSPTSFQFRHACWDTKRRIRKQQQQQS